MDTDSTQYTRMADEHLTGLARSGDQLAFSELLARTAPNSLKLAYSILKDREEAEDQVQNASFNAWRHVAHFQQEARFSTWFTRIVVNQCLMRLRKVRRTPVVSIESSFPGEDKPLLEAIDLNANAENALGRKELRAVLAKEISRIPPLFRSVLLKRDVEGLPIPAVAEQLGISIPAVKSRLLRARGELRERLKKHFGSRADPLVRGGPPGPTAQGPGNRPFTGSPAKPAKPKPK